MPSISMFYGITIYMYQRDDGKHKTPHIHAKYAGEYTSFDITTGDIIKGKMPNKQAQLVKAWILFRNDELIANWDLAIDGQALYKIAPL